MKKLLIMLGLITMLASFAMAGQVQVGYLGSGYGAYQSGFGGEFTLTPINPAGWLDLSSYDARAKDVGVSGSFQTFCIDGVDNIYPNGIYNASDNCPNLFNPDQGDADIDFHGAAFLNIR